MIKATPRHLYTRERNPVPSAKETGYASQPIQMVVESLAPTGIWFRGVQPVTITYLLTPWSKVRLEKPTGLQLVKKFPAFYRTRRLITAFTSARHMSSQQSISPRPRQVYMFHNKASFTVTIYQHFTQLPSCRTTPCRLSATAYSMYSQLPSKLEDVPPSAIYRRAMPCGASITVRKHVGCIISTIWIGGSLVHNFG